MKLKSIPSLSLKQWIWGLEASVRLYALRLRLRFSKPTWIHSKINFSEVQPEVASGTDRLVPAQVIAMHESVRLAARIQPGTVACLPRSLVLANMLQARGLNGKVIIGVAKQGERFASHAWVELDSRIVAEPERVTRDFKQLSR